MGTNQYRSKMYQQKQKTRKNTDNLAVRVLLFKPGCLNIEFLIVKPLKLTNNCKNVKTGIKSGPKAGGCHPNTGNAGTILASSKFVQKLLCQTYV